MISGRHEVAAHLLDGNRAALVHLLLDQHIGNLNSHVLELPVRGAGKKDLAVAKDAELDEQHDRHALEQVDTVIPNGGVMLLKELL